MWCGTIDSRLWRIDLVISSCCYIRCNLTRPILADSDVVHAFVANTAAVVASTAYKVATLKTPQFLFQDVMALQLLLTVPISYSEIPISARISDCMEVRSLRASVWLALSSQSCSKQFGYPFTQTAVKMYERTSTKMSLTMLIVRARTKKAPR